MDDELCRELEFEMPVNFASLLECEELTPVHINSMTGNGWNLVAAGIQVMWLLGIIEDRGSYCELPGSLQLKLVNYPDDVEIQNPDGDDEKENVATTVERFKKALLHHAGVL